MNSAWLEKCKTSSEWEGAFSMVPRGPKTLFLGESLRRQCFFGSAVSRIQLGMATGKALSTISPALGSGT